MAEHSILNHRALTLLLFTLFSCSPGARADSVAWQGFEIHYTVFNSMVIPAEVAKLHNIVRSRYHIVTNITVRRDGKAVRASITGSNTNLLNQLFTMEFAEVEEPGAIYYLANQLIDERDHLRFAINIQPEGSEDTLALSFRRQY